MAEIAEIEGKLEELREQYVKELKYVSGHFLALRSTGFKLTLCMRALAGPKASCTGIAARARRRSTRSRVSLSIGLFQMATDRTSLFSLATVPAKTVVPKNWTKTGSTKVRSWPLLTGTVFLALSHPIFRLSLVTKRPGQHLSSRAFRKRARRGREPSSR